MSIMLTEYFLSFKTSVTHIFFNFTPHSCVRLEAAFFGHNSIFCQTLSDVQC